MAAVVTWDVFTDCCGEVIMLLREVGDRSIISKMLGLVTVVPVPVPAAPPGPPLKEYWG